LLTREGAKKNYGVIVKSDYTVSKAATTKLREKLSKERGKTKLFDKGFESIAELKKRCKEETGLDAPSDPVFQTWVKAAS